MCCTRKIILIGIVLAALASAPSHGFQYESKGRRDPFVPLVGQEKPGFVGLEDVTSISEVKLEGIAIEDKGRKIAMINGELLRENDKVGDVEIKEITKKSVTLLLGGKPYTVSLSEEGGSGG